MEKQKCTFRFDGGIKTFDSLNEAKKEFGITRTQLLNFISNGSLFYDGHNRIVQYVKEK